MPNPCCKKCYDPIKNSDIYRCMDIDCKCHSTEKPPKQETGFRETIRKEPLDWPTDTSELSRFIREASPEEKKRVWLEIAKEASADQRAAMTDMSDWREQFSETDFGFVMKAKPKQALEAFIEKQLEAGRADERARLRKMIAGMKKPAASVETEENERGIPKGYNAALTDLLAALEDKN